MKGRARRRGKIGTRTTTNKGTTQNHRVRAFHSEEAAILMHRICRIDRARSRTHAWLVRVQRRNHIHQRYFSDHLHGGKRNALMAAKAYRDTLTQTLPVLSRKEFCTIRKKNNRSGVSGISRHESAGRTSSSPRHVFWLAQWPIGGGKAKRRKFSVKKYGERGAFLRACRARNQALLDLGNHPFRDIATDLPPNSWTPS